MTQTDDTKTLPKLYIEWVKALRSGRFKQTQRTLSKIDGLERSYCCLGLLCELSEEGEWIRDQRDGRSSYVFPGKRNEHVRYDAIIWQFEDQAPNRRTPRIGEVVDLIKAKIVEAGEPDKCGLSALTNMNDGGSSFEEIADFLEREIGSVDA